MPCLRCVRAQRLGRPRLLSNCVRWSVGILRRRALCWGTQRRRDHPRLDAKRRARKHLDHDRACRSAVAAMAAITAWTLAAARAGGRNGARRGVADRNRRHHEQRDRTKRKPVEHRRESLHGAVVGPKRPKRDGLETDLNHSPASSGASASAAASWAAASRPMERTRRTEHPGRVVAGKSRGQVLKRSMKATGPSSL